MWPAGHALQQSDLDLICAMSKSVRHPCFLPIIVRVLTRALVMHVLTSWQEPIRTLARRWQTERVSLDVVRRVFRAV